MGVILCYICPECGYRFGGNFGVGMMFPLAYMETAEEMKNGEKGEEAKKFFAEHPDGAVNCKYVLMRCTECGQYDCREDLTMYVPKEGYTHNIPKGKCSVAMPFSGCDYVSDYELEECYTVFAEYPHKCEKCGGNMKILRDDDVKTCPDCGAELEEHECGCWD